jgi:hypothetical protein
MLLFNIIFASLALFFAYRGARLFWVSRKAGQVKESTIALALMLMHCLICIRSLLLIEVGPQKIEQAGLLLNYYMYLGTVTLQMLISDFIIKFVYDRIKTTTES